MPETPTNQPSAVDEDLLQGFLKQCTTYKREILAAVIILVGGSIVYAIAESTQREAEQKAMDALFRTTQKHKKAEERNVAVGEVIQNHKETRAASLAMIRQITALADEGKVDDALKMVSSYEARFKGEPLAPLVQLAKAQLLLNQNKYSEAKALATSMLAGIKTSTHGYLEAELRLVEAQCLDLEAEANKGQASYAGLLEKARDAYLNIRNRDGWPPAHPMLLRSKPIQEQAAFAVVSLSHRLRLASGEPATALMPEPKPEPKKDPEAPEAKPEETEAKPAPAPKDGDKKDPAPEAGKDAKAPEKAAPAEGKKPAEVAPAPKADPKAK